MMRRIRFVLLMVSTFFLGLGARQGGPPIGEAPSAGPTG